MPYPVIIVPFMKVDGMAIYPFILLRRKSDIGNKVLINHEKIHLQQQLELLILPFYLVYLFIYLINRLKHNHDAAYRHIIFEREAFNEEANLAYLSRRQLWAWRKY